MRLAIHWAMSSRRASIAGKATSRTASSSAQNAPASSSADIATSRTARAAKDGVDKCAGIMKVGDPTTIVAEASLAECDHRRCTA